MFCSDFGEEPLPGTSKSGSVYVVVEHEGAWSHDILDGGTFDAETTAQLKSLPASLYLVRKHGREGHEKKERRTVYLVFCEEQVTEVLTVGSIDEVMSLDLGGPGRNAERGAIRLEEPLLLVCTHSKRDVCCALKGRPMAKALTEAFPGAHIWESSHTKGHRFAPSMVLFPQSYSFGKLNEKAAEAMFAAARQGELFLPGNRGRGIWSPAGQVAELAVAEQLEHPALGELDVEVAEKEAIVRGRGRSWRVSLEQRDVGPVMASCGTDPKPGKAWVATSISEI